MFFSEPTDTTESDESFFAGRDLPNTTGYVASSDVESIAIVLTSLILQYQVATAQKSNVASPPTPEQSAPPAACSSGGTCVVFVFFFLPFAQKKHFFLPRLSVASLKPSLPISLPPISLDVAGYTQSSGTTRHAKHLSPPKKLSMQVSSPRGSFRS